MQQTKQPRRPRVGQYHYSLRGRCFRIYRYTMVTETAASSEPVITEPSFTDPEAARHRVYELNGWKYTPRKQSPQS